MGSWTDFIVNSSAASPGIRYQSSEVGSQATEVSHGTLKIFDVLGREIATHVDEVKKAGSFTISFDASRLTFSLEQHCPNPFNPRTKIRFTIPVGTGYIPSVLKVYDVLGGEVATLVNEELQAGNYERTFDAEGLASGVYFYRLHAGTFIATRKMLVTK